MLWTQCCWPPDLPADNAACLHVCRRSSRGVYYHSHVPAWRTLPCYSHSLSSDAATTPAFTRPIVAAVRQHRHRPIHDVTTPAVHTPKGMNQCVATWRASAGRNFLPTDATFIWSAPATNIADQQTADSTKHAAHGGFSPKSAITNRHSRFKCVGVVMENCYVMWE